MAYATTTLTGTYLHFDGTPAEGFVEIIPSEPVVKDTTGNTILSGRVKVTLDAAGHFSVALPATDDPNLNPTGFGYTVAAKLRHHHPAAVSFALPAGGPVDIENVTPVDPSTFAPGVTYVEQNAADAAYATKATQTTVETGRLTDAALSATYGRHAEGLSLYRGQVGISDRSGINRDSNTYTATATDYRQFIFRTRHVCGRKTRNVRLVFHGWMWLDVSPGEASPLPNSVTVQAGFELADGTIFPVRFSGSRNGTVVPDGILMSDPVPVALAKGDVFYTRTQANIDTGQVLWANLWHLASIRPGEGDERNGSGATLADKTTSGTIYAGWGSQRRFCYGPTHIIGDAVDNDPTVAVIGDSITAGYLDDTADTKDRGFLARALSGVHGTLRVAGPGSKASDFRAALTGEKRRVQIGGSTHAVISLGTNDYRASPAPTFAAMQTDALAIWNALSAQGMKVYACTIGPGSSSTDSWATTANQTKHPNDAVRVQFNDWIRTTPAPLSGFFEVADAMESARNSGVWKVNGTASWATTDGVHPTSAMHDLMRDAVKARLPLT